MNTLLNCFPPTRTIYPSPAMSILKSFMIANGYKTDIKYWNFVLEDFQIRFLGNHVENIKHQIYSLLPFINYIWVNSGEGLEKSNLTYQLLSMNPSLYNFGFDHLEKIMIQYADDLDQIISAEISKMDLDKYHLFGITTKFYQWICGGIVAKKIKALFPEMKIVVGGFGTSNEALAMMNSFNYYDYAIWGEGEYPLLRLCEKIESMSDIEVPFLIYRDKDGLPQISQSKKKEFIDLRSGIFPDYSDYFFQIDRNQDYSRLPLERSRGCHWNKCRFCFLNDGYRYRTKPNDVIIKEIKHQIEKYNTRIFDFLDNDLIGKDINDFEDFLDKLIKLKEVYGDFSIRSAEITTKNINSNIVKKMALGGIHFVQIGYESPSNQLLQKIKKKNSFASNLLFIKWAKQFSINITGLNVLQGLLEETVDDIFEATDNLYYLRFFLAQKGIKHHPQRLVISESSPYFQDLIKFRTLEDWNMSPFQDLLPHNYYKHADRYCLFQYANNDSDAMQWKFFYQVEEHFINSKYDYKIINHLGINHYREYFNNELIIELVFDDPIYWEILKSCNHHVSSLTELCTVLSSTKNNIVSTVKSLKSKGLLYHSEDFSEIVTPIDTDIAI